MEVLHFEKSQLEEEARELGKGRKRSPQDGGRETMKQREEQVQSPKKVEDLREEADRLGAITERNFPLLEENREAWRPRGSPSQTARRR
jgi:hypothetical protein